MGYGPVLAWNQWGERVSAGRGGQGEAGSVRPLKPGVRCAVVRQGARGEVGEVGEGSVQRNGRRGKREVNKVEKSQNSLNLSDGNSIEAVL